MADIGITYSSVPSSLISQSGKFLSDNIREIGKSVQASILEINTRRDLQRMAQDMQGMNVQSDDFPMQLTQLMSSHPLAARDERGQLAMNVLGKAHGQWQSEQMLASRLQNQLTGIGLRNEAALGQIAARTAANQEMEGFRQEGRESLETLRQTGRTGLEDQRQSGRIEMEGVRQTGREELESQRQAGREQLQESRQQGAMELNDARAKQREQAERRKTEFTGAKQRITAIEKDIDRLRNSINLADKEEQSLGESFSKARRDERRVWQTQIEQKLKEREQAQKELDVILVEPELGPVPDGAAAPQGDGVGVLPDGASVPAPASNTEFVAVFDPQGKPGRVRASQLESALANGYRRR